MPRILPDVNASEFQSGISKDLTREQLHQDLLSGLGAPIIRIDLTAQHIDKAIDYALKMFWKFHPDGSFENYYTITLSALDVSNGYINIPQWIDQVADILPTNSVGSFGTIGNALTVNAIGALNGTVQVSNTPLVDGVAQVGGMVNGLDHFNGAVYNQSSYAEYVQALSNIDMMNSLTGNGAKSKYFKHAHYQRRCYLYFPIKEGDILALKCYENLDPTTKPENAEAFDNEWLKAMATAQCKITWGNILRKYGGINIAGGVTLDGSVLVEEGNREADGLMAEVQGYVTMPFYVG